MGAEAIQKMLASIDLATLVTDLQEQLDNTNSKQNKRKIAKRLKLAQGFLQSNTRPEWMILNVLPSFLRTCARWFPWKAAASPHPT